MFLDHFEVLISRINFIKIIKKYIFNIFSNKKILKYNQYYIFKFNFKPCHIELPLSDETAGFSV
jgi:hypothetical protein